MQRSRKNFIIFVFFQSRNTAFRMAKESLLSNFELRPESANTTLILVLCFQRSSLLERCLLFCNLRPHREHDYHCDFASKVEANIKHIYTHPDEDASSLG